MAYGDIFNPVLTEQNLLGSFSDGALADPLPVFGRVKQEKAKAGAAAVQQTFAQQAASAAADEARIESSVSTEKNAFGSYGSLDPNRPLNSTVFDPATNAQRLLTRQEVVDQAKSIEKLDVNAKFVSEALKIKHNPLFDERPRSMAAKNFNVRSEIVNRNNEYQNALNNKGIDSVSRQEIVTMYESGETAATIAATVAAALEGKGKYANRIINDQQAKNIQNSPSARRPNRAGVL